MGKLRLGVIGAGSMAVAFHLPNIAKRRDEVDFVAVARKGPELLEKIRHDFGFRVASEDYKDVIDAGIDICVVASPTGLHYEHAKAALEAGVHVLIEKPMTINPAEAWELVATAERKNLQLVCCFGWNFLPMLQNAKRLMETEGIGEIEYISVYMSSATRELLSNRGAYPDAAPECARAGDVDRPAPLRWRLRPGAAVARFGFRSLAHGLAWRRGVRVHVDDPRLAGGAL